MVDSQQVGLAIIHPHLPPLAEAVDSQNVDADVKAMQGSMVLTISWEGFKKAVVAQTGSRSR